MNPNIALTALFLAAAGLLGWTLGERHGRETAPEYVSLKKERRAALDASMEQEIEDMKFSDDPAYDACQKIFWIVEESLFDQASPTISFDDLIPDHRP